MRILTKLTTLIILFIVMCTDVICKTPDPYKILGISKSATEDDIKKAFNKRSKKYHPDINKQDPRAKEKFTKVVNAYQLLKDPERRKMYDMTGSDDPNQGMNMGGGGFPGGGFPGGGFGINIEDLLNMGFGGFGGGFGGGGQRHPGGGQRQQGGARTYTFTFGGGGQGGQGFRFQM